MSITAEETRDLIIDGLHYANEAAIALANFDIVNAEKNLWHAEIHANFAWLNLETKKDEFDSAKYAAYIKWFERLDSLNDRICSTVDKMRDVRVDSLILKDEISHHLPRKRA